MFFIKPRLRCSIALITLGLLSACAQKPVEQVPISAEEQARLAQVQQAQQTAQAQFDAILKRLRAENIQKQELEQALQELDAIYQAHPAYLGALINAADIAFKLEQYEPAKQRYLQVLDVQAKSDTAIETNTAAENHLDLTQTKQEQVNLVPPSKHLQAFKLHALNQLGLLARKTGEFEAAEAYYRDALELDAQHPVSLKNLAILLDLYRGRLAEALVYYEQYQGLVGESQPQVKDWIFDLKNRLPTDTDSAEASEVNND